jgi:hypothetical protein
MYDKIHPVMSIEPGNAYDAAKSYSGNGKPFIFLSWFFLVVSFSHPVDIVYDISNWTGGDDRYSNKFTVNITSNLTTATTTVNFTGKVVLHKEVCSSALFWFLFFIRRVPRT